MIFSVIPSDKFKRETKRLIKKFPSLKQDLPIQVQHLNKPQRQVQLGNNTYKIRLAIKTKGKGKSGGARVITYLVTQNQEIYLLTIYDKSEFDSIDDNVIKISLRL